MTPYFEQESIQIYLGNALKILEELPAESVHCVVTSPPYWELRDYETGRWDGGDPKCEHSCGGQVQDTKAPGAITTGVRPGCDASICKKCGAVRLDEQIGLERNPDEYIENLVKVFRQVRRVTRKDGTLWVNIGDSYSSQGGRNPHTAPGGTGNSTNTNLVQPARVPPSGYKAKDLVGIPWMLAFALRADGWYLRQDIIWSKPNPMPESVLDRCTKAHEYVFLLSKSAKYYYDSDSIKEESVTNDTRKPYAPGQVDRRGNGHDRNGGVDTDRDGNYRNKRSVWEIATKPFPEAHFATFPTELVKPCILAGCHEGGTVLDPFSGSGTTGLVARDNGCKYIGIELNAEYIEISARRLAQEVFSFS
jgi:DNA modification methylase